MEYGASVEEVKALGNWLQGGLFRACYNRALPLGAMLALAGFNGDQKDAYFIARSQLGMFPTWI